MSGGRDKVAPTTTNNELLSAGFEKRGRPFLSRSLRFGDLALDSLYLPEYLTRYALTKTTEILFNRFYLDGRGSLDVQEEILLERIHDALASLAARVRKKTEAITSD